MLGAFRTHVMGAPSTFGRSPCRYTLNGRTGARAGAWIIELRETACRRRSWRSLLEICKWGLWEAQVVVKATANRRHILHKRVNLIVRKTTHCIVNHSLLFRKEVWTNVGMDCARKASSLFYPKLNQLNSASLYETPQFCKPRRS